MYDLVCGAPREKFPAMCPKGFHLRKEGSAQKYLSTRFEYVTAYHPDPQLCDYNLNRFLEPAFLKNIPDNDPHINVEYKNFKMDKIPTGDFDFEAIAEHDLASTPHAPSNYATS